MAPCFKITPDGAGARSQTEKEKLQVETQVQMHACINQNTCSCMKIAEKTNEIKMNTNKRKRPRTQITYENERNSDAATSTSTERATIIRRPSMSPRYTSTAAWVNSNSKSDKSRDEEEKPIWTRACKRQMNMNAFKGGLGKEVQSPLTATSMDTLKEEKESDRSKALKEIVSDLASEITCSICTEPFLNTTTLCCGHSFCELCIHRWLRTALVCPLCRAPLTKPPVYSHTMDKVISIMLQNNPVAVDEFRRRKEESKNTLERCEKAKENFEKLLAQARKDGHRLVHIQNIWSEREQKRFLFGIKNYEGPVRQAYCKSVYLSADLVDRMSEHDLAIAAFNLKLKKMADTFNSSQDAPNSDHYDDISYYIEWAKNEVASLRARIHLFLLFA